MKYCLLDQLAEQTKVNYISELKSKELVKPYATYIQSLHDDTFSLDDWKDVCEYLLKDSVDVKNVDDAKKRIITWLQS